MAILPTAELVVISSSVTNNNNHIANGVGDKIFLASQATFGAALSQDRSALLSHPLRSTGSSLLCGNLTADNGNTNDNMYENSILLVPRGECTYQHKAYRAQQMGAKGVVIFNNLASRYSLNTTTSITTTSSANKGHNKDDDEKDLTHDDVLFPQPFYDYDCQLGSADVPTNEFRFVDWKYDAEHNDPLLSGGTSANLCKANSPERLDRCPSDRCLLTDYAPGESTAKACCAWDLHLRLYGDDSKLDVRIPAVFVTMEQGQALLDLLSQSNDNNDSLSVILKARWQPTYNPSSFLVWLLGVTVAAVAAYQSAGDYHIGIRKLALRQRHQQESSGREDKRTRGPSSEPLATRNPMQEEAVELEPIHAVGFIAMASTSLFILFYFKIYNFVKVFYAFGCSNAIVQVLIYPNVSRLFVKLGAKERTIYQSQEFGKISNWHMMSAVLSYAWGMGWLYMALFVRRPDSYFFYWVTQDIFGACMCIVFLSIIEINSIQVATILLIVAFFYDIFFVFITPYLFKGESIMMAVATSGGPPKKDPLWCEKYPSDHDCQGGDPLPMLFAIPRLFDYQGGSSLLGLGDIVLPGLLLSFAARFDAAKALVGISSGGNEQQTSSVMECSGNGATFLGSFRRGPYFIPLVIAYAIGLMMANIAVYVMEMGQPALLYLVPCTLGTMACLGWKRRDLRALWEGPKVLQWADSIVYGTPAPSSHSSQISMESIGQSDDTSEGGMERSAPADAGQSNTSRAAAEDDEAGPLLASASSKKSLD